MKTLNIHCVFNKENVKNLCNVSKEIDIPLMIVFHPSPVDNSKTEVSMMAAGTSLAIKEFPFDMSSTLRPVRYFNNITERVGRCAYSDHPLIELGVPPFAIVLDRDVVESRSSLKRGESVEISISINESMFSESGVFNIENCHSESSDKCGHVDVGVINDNGKLVHVESRPILVKEFNLRHYVQKAGRYSALIHEFSVYYNSVVEDPNVNLNGVKRISLDDIEESISTSIQSFGIKTKMAFTKDNPNTHYKTAYVFEVDDMNAPWRTSPLQDRPTLSIKLCRMAEEKKKIEL